MRTDRAQKWRFLSLVAIATIGGLAGSAGYWANASKPAEIPQSAPQGNRTALSMPNDHWTGDLDGMIKRRQIRALVVYGKSAFFYDQGRPEGISFEALQEFQRTLNSELHTGRLPLTITFLPVGFNELEQNLEKGLGDLIAVPVAITPEREQRVAFRHHL
jgi:ABC-type amino acid transport substrate-binding protein